MTGDGTSAGSRSALDRFQSSMVMDYEKWHDGIGYDLAALAEATPSERDAIERLLLDRGTRDWRDVEALALLDTPAARAALREALSSGDAEIRLAVTRHAPALIGEAQRAASLVQALKSAGPFAGLTQVLDEAEQFHPPEVVEALLQGTLEREGDVAVHLAALLLFLHGKADEPFDMEHRPFFLRFNTDDRAKREAAFRELCGRVGADAQTILEREEARGSYK